MRFLLPFFAILHFSALSSVLAEPEPVLFFDFSAPGSEQSSTGSEMVVLSTSITGGETVDRVIRSQTGDSMLGFAGTQSDILLGGPIFLPGFVSDLGSFTIAAWIENYTPNGDHNRLFYLSNGSAPLVDFNLIGNAEGVKRLYIILNGVVAYSDRQPMVTDAWNFVGVTYDNSDGSVVFYTGHEGGLLTTHFRRIEIPPPYSRQADHLSIGNDQNRRKHLDANIRSVAFYDAALTDEDIHALFQAGVEGR